MEAMLYFIKDKIVSLTFDNILIYIFALVAALFCLKKWMQKRDKLPPGPYGLPFLGYIPFLGDDPSKKFDELSKSYGGIFSVKLGSNLVVILNDYDALKEVMGNPSSLDRPIEAFDFFVNIGFGTKNGEEWQEQRRASIQLMRDLGLGKSQWEILVQDEVKDFIEKMEQHKGNPVDCDIELRICVINNVISLLIGRNLKDEEKDIAARYAENALSEGSPVSLKTQSSLWRKLLQHSQLSDLHSKASLLTKFLHILKMEMHKHSTVPEYEGRMDFMNLYLEKMKQFKSKDNSYSETSLLGNINVLFIGAADTTHVTLLWLFRLMAKYPHVQRRVQKELDEVMGQNGTISFDDKPKLPYTVSVITETLRYSSIVPLSTARRAASDFKIRGYTIPKGAQITANLKAIHHNPKYWEGPEEFRPERFLKNGGKEVESNFPSYAPFSYGRRGCPGERIFWMEALIVFSMVCYHFTITPPAGEEIHFDTKPGLVFALKPQRICFTKRK